MDKVIVSPSYCSGLHLVRNGRALNLPITGTRAECSGHSARLQPKQSGFESTVSRTRESCRMMSLVRGFFTVLFPTPFHFSAAPWLGLSSQQGMAGAYGPPHESPTTRMMILIRSLLSCYYLSITYSFALNEFATSAMSFALTLEPVRLLGVIWQRPML